MSEDIKYPYIGKGNESGTVVMMLKPECGVIIKSKTWATKDGRLETSIDEFYVTNITREYLQPSHGYVVSLEHAKLIVELCENHGITLENNYSSQCKEFQIYSNKLIFKHNIPHSNAKKITIPLPPESKEWAPEVGCDAFTCTDRLVSILAIDDCNAWVRYKEAQGHYNTITLAKLKKPKSAQELKIEELQTKLCENNAVDNYILACDIVMGNIEGLSYE